jgi:hypothetical protein
MKKNETLISWISLALTALPIIWVLVEFYSQQNILANTVKNLEDDKAYIRSKLDQIVEKIAVLNGKIDEHVIGDFKKCR